jgi:hypothetical protein
MNLHPQTIIGLLLLDAVMLIMCITQIIEIRKDINQLKK